eukprot:2543185-Pyramimonas_sp.AAC.1
MHTHPMTMRLYVNLLLQARKRRNGSSVCANVRVRHISGGAAALAGRAPLHAGAPPPRVRVRHAAAVHHSAAAVPRGQARVRAPRLHR